MAIRSLPSLAHALSVAPDLDAALIALGESLSDSDRSAVLGLIRYDGRKDILQDRLTPSGGQVVKTRVDTTFDHLPSQVRSQLPAGGQFIDLGEKSAEYARLLGLSTFSDGGSLSLRGLSTDGQLSAVLLLQEQRRMFGTRTSERFAPAAALFDLAFARFQEREARDEAVRTLEDVTQRVHGDYVKRLATLQNELGQARTSGAHAGTVDGSRAVDVERDLATTREDLRKAVRKNASLEGQLMAAVGQLEQAHIELHRRSETLRQKVRTLYLIERTLKVDNTAQNVTQLVDGILALVGDDMQAQRCSLMLRAPEPDTLFLAAFRGLAPNITVGHRVPLKKGTVSGTVAATREPLLVQDASEVSNHPLLRDQYLTTGSFISFPLVYRDELVGVVNLTNRAKAGVFIEEDVERVALLGLVISLIATSADLPARLLETIGAA
ncbi:MAG: GAF domain-containing protein [Gemmatimonadota bacterium]